MNNLEVRGYVPIDPREWEPPPPYSAAIPLPWRPSAPGGENEENQRQRQPEAREVSIAVTGASREPARRQLLLPNQPQMHVSPPPVQVTQRKSKNNALKTCCTVTLIIVLLVKFILLLIKLGAFRWYHSFCSLSKSYFVLITSKLLKKILTSDNWSSLNTS